MWKLFPHIMPCTIYVGITNKSGTGQGFEKFNLLKWVSDSVAPAEEDNFKTVLPAGDWQKVIMSDVWLTYLLTLWLFAEIKQLWKIMKNSWTKSWKRVINQNITTSCSCSSLLGSTLAFDFQGSVTVTFWFSGSVKLTFWFSRVSNTYIFIFKGR